MAGRLKQHLVAWWKMDDNAASSVVLDSHGSYNGAYTDKDGVLNTSTGTASGKNYKSLYFDGRQAIGGTDEHVDLGDPFESVFQGDFSISLWAKPTDGQPANSGYIFGLTTLGEADCVWIVHSNIGSLTYRYTSNGNAATLGPPVYNFSDGQQDWHHIVMVVDSVIRGIGGVKGFVNGQPQPLGAVFKGDTSSVVSADFASAINAFLAAESGVGGAANIYQGHIDNAMLFDITLTPSDVRRLFNSGRGVSKYSEFEHSARPTRSRYRARYY